MQPQLGQSQMGKEIQHLRLGMVLEEPIRSLLVDRSTWGLLDLVVWNLFDLVLVVVLVVVMVVSMIGDHSLVLPSISKLGTRNNAPVALGTSQNQLTQVLVASNLEWNQ